MKHNPMEARCVFIDGPVAVYVSEDRLEDILASFDRLRKVVAVAAEQIGRIDVTAELRTAQWVKLLESLPAEYQPGLLVLLEHAYQAGSERDV